jgi:predicted ATPase
MIARFMGDGVLCYFGYPQATENDAERAVRAGLKLVEAVPRLLNGGLTLQARVGIATGLVVVGDLIGEGVSQEQNVVGETPSLAARLQTLAEPGSVIIADGTRHLLGNRFDVIDLGNHELKGFKLPTRIWRVLGEADAEHRLNASRALGSRYLVGRGSELKHLLNRWETAKTGRGQVVLVTSEPGVGKSRLAHEIIDNLIASDTPRLLYYCSPFHTNSSLYPVLEQVQRAAGFTKDDDKDGKFTKLRTLIDRFGHSPKAIPILAYLLSLPGSEQHPNADLTPQRQREVTLTALADLVIDLARSTSVVIVVEDLQWIDPTSLALVDMLVDRVRSLPVLMILTFRTEFVARWQQDHISRLILDRLTHEETTELISELTHGEKLPAELTEQIIVKTDGIPLFIEELTKMILESGIIVRTGERYQLAVSDASLAVPSTLRDSLMARLDRLAPVKEVAQIGAAIGRRFSYDLLSAVTRWPHSALDIALKQLVEAGLIFESGTAPNSDYTFKHALVQDTAYDSLLRTRRRVLHSQIAKALQDHFPEVVSAQPEVLAHHYTGAGDLENAVRLWINAGRRSGERSSPREAIAHFETALEVLRALPETSVRDKTEVAIRIALVTPTMAIGGYSSVETERVIAEARTIAEKVGETAALFPILYGEWVAKLARGKIRDSTDLAEDFMRLAQRQADTTPLVVAHRMVGSALTNLGELGAGRYHLEACVALYDPAIHAASASLYGQDSRVTALSFLSWTLFALGLPTKALDAARQAIQYAEAMKHANTQGVALCLAGLILQGLFRDLSALEVCAQKAITVAEVQGLGLWLPTAKILEGWLIGKKGNPDRAITQIKKGLEDIKSVGVFIVRSHFLGILAETYSDVGQYELALSTIDEALGVMEETNERIWESDLYRIKGELLIRSGKSAVAAEAALTQAIDVANRQGARLWSLRAATRLAELWNQQGQCEKARHLLQPTFGQCDDKLEIADVIEARGLLHLLRTSSTAADSEPKNR